MGSFVSGWTTIRWTERLLRGGFTSVQFVLLTGRVVELSLDNDLDNPEGWENTFGTGYQVIDFLEEQQEVAGRSLWPRDGIVLHTANSQGRERMARSFEPLKRKADLAVKEERTPGGKPRFTVESN